MCIVPKGFPKVSSTKCWVSQGSVGFLHSCQRFWTRIQRKSSVSEGFPTGFPKVSLGFWVFLHVSEKWLIKKASLLNVTFLKSIASGRPCSWLLLGSTIWYPQLRHKRPRAYTVQKTPQCRFCLSGCCFLVVCWWAFCLGCRGGVCSGK